MITGDDDPPKMIGAKHHKVMTHNMDLSKVKKELLRQVKLNSDDTRVDEEVCAIHCAWSRNKWPVQICLKWPLVECMYLDAGVSLDLSCPRACSHQAM